MQVELHIIQNFAPANLNSDDTGMPKECIFGGHLRARISSQCLKRAAREDFASLNLLPPETRAVRTRRLAIELVGQLEVSGKDRDIAEDVVRFVLGGVGLKLDDKNLTEYLLFLGTREIAGLSELCLERWDDLVERVRAGIDKTVARRRKPSTVKKEMRKVVPVGIRRATESVLDGGRSADIALFGRHIADLPDRDAEAALRVAHAISTNRLAPELDYFTALDDLQPDGVRGAGMLSNFGFNSSCFYRYSDVNVRALRQNLQGDGELALYSLEAVIRASIRAVPRGNQSRAAAHNPPSFVLAVVRKDGPWNLVNGFASPVRPTWEKDIVTLSVEALDQYWGRLASRYGEGDIVGRWAISLGDETLENLGESMVPDVERLVGYVMASVRREI